MDIRNSLIISLKSIAEYDFNVGLHIWALFAADVCCPFEPLFRPIFENSTGKYGIDVEKTMKSTLAVYFPMWLRIISANTVRKMLGCDIIRKSIIESEDPSTILIICRSADHVKVIAPLAHSWRLERLRIIYGICAKGYIDIIDAFTQPPFNFCRRDLFIDGFCSCVAACLYGGKFSIIRRFVDPPFNIGINDISEYTLKRLAYDGNIPAIEFLIGEPLKLPKNRVLTDILNTAVKCEHITMVSMLSNEYKITESEIAAYVAEEVLSKCSTEMAIALGMIMPY